MADIQRLPDTMLAEVLRHVPQQQRLQSCARTCRSWKAATLAATDSIHHFCCSRANKEQLLAWLAVHGQQIGSLALTADMDLVTGHYKPAMQFQTLMQTCARLKSLKLQHWHITINVGPPVAQRCNLRSGSSSTAASRPQPGLTSLTSLACMDCQVPDLQHLSILTQLVELQLVRVSKAACRSCMRLSCTGSLCTVPGAALSALSALTLLKLQPVSNDALAVLSHLTGLRSLECTEFTPEYVSQVQHLKQLTRLDVSGALYGLHRPVITSAAANTITQLTALQHLKLANFREFDPAVLAGLQQMRKLELSCLVLSGGNAGPVALLSTVGQLTALQHINVLDRAVLCNPSAPTAAHSALVASSQLQTLECTLPAAAWRHIFQPGGRQLPQLQTLSLETLAHPRLNTADLEAIVAACPGLQSMTFGIYVSYTDMQLTPLTRLTALTALKVKAADKHTVTAAAELTRLQQLELTGRTIKYHDCYQLAKLTRLMSLEMYDLDNGMTTILQGDRAAEGRRPHVWESLVFELMEIEIKGVAARHAAWCQHFGIGDDESDYDSDGF